MPAIDESGPWLHGTRHPIDGDRVHAGAQMNVNNHPDHHDGSRVWITKSLVTAMFYAGSPARRVFVYEVVPDDTPIEHPERPGEFSTSGATVVRAIADSVKLLSYTKPTPPA